MDSIIDRNATSHAYDDETADDIYRTIISIYYPLFKDFERVMNDALRTE